MLDSLMLELARLFDWEWGSIVGGVYSLFDCRFKMGFGGSMSVLSWKKLGLC